MAIPADAVFEVRANGSDTNGGFFNPTRGGTDYSNQQFPVVTANGILTANGTTTVTTAYGVFNSSMPGNSIWIGGSINTVFEIISVNSSTSAVLDRVPGTGSGIDLRIGGALATPGRASQLMVAGNRLWIRGGTYTILLGAQNVADGRPSFAGGISGGNQMIVEGYSTTRGDMVMGGTPPVTIKTNVTAGANYLVNTAAGTVLRNIIVDNGRIPGSGPQNMGISATNSRLENVHSYRTEGQGISLNNCVAVRCVVDGALSSGLVVTNSTISECVIKNCTSGNAINCSGSGIICANRCTVFNCSSSGFLLGSATATNVDIDRCVFDQCGIAINRGSGSTSNQVWNVTNNIISRSTSGIYSGIAASNISARNCAFWANTTDIGATGNIETINKISLTADPFYGLSSRDYRLTTPSAIRLRAAGFDVPGSWLTSLNVPAAINSQFIPVSL